MSHRFPVLSPFEYFAIEVNRLHQVIFDLKQEETLFPEATKSVNADCLAVWLRRIKEMQEILQTQLEPIRTIVDLGRDYGCLEFSENSKEFKVGNQIEEIQQTLETLPVNINNRYESIQLALILVRDIENREEDIQNVNRGNVRCKMHGKVDVTYAALPCGHPFCAKCKEVLECCAFCKHEIQSCLKIYTD